MRFWKYLRWISAIAFLALVMAVWLSNGQSSSSSSSTGGGLPQLPPAPTFVR